MVAKKCNLTIVVCLFWCVKGDQLEGIVRLIWRGRGRASGQPSSMTKSSSFRYVRTSPEIIRLAVMLYVRFPFPLRNVEDLLHERGIDFSHKTLRFWWNRFGPMFAAEIRRNWINRVRA